MKIIEVNTYEQMSLKAAELIANRLKEKEKFVLGLATGGTPEGAYKLLIEWNKAKKLTFAHVTSFNLDEYIGLDRENPSSYYYFMMDNLFNHVDIDRNMIHIPNGLAADLDEECARYETAIASAGGIDLQLLGIGQNGHIAFNEPGTSFDSKTHIIELTPSTREVNARFFDDPNEVPSQAITMGIDSIMQSKELLLLASGKEKADAMKQLIEGEITEAFPASALKQHTRFTIIADKAALSKVKWS